LSQSMRVTDRRTDRQNYDSQDHFRICSSGKNSIPRFDTVILITPVILDRALYATFVGPVSQTYPKFAPKCGQMVSKVRVVYSCLQTASPTWDSFLTRPLCITSRAPYVIGCRRLQVGLQPHSIMRSPASVAR